MNYEEIITKIQSQKRFGKAYGRDVTAEICGRYEQSGLGDGAGKEAKDQQFQPI
jgi:hypothetical protein